MGIPVNELLEYLALHWWPLALAQVPGPCSLPNRETELANRCWYVVGLDLASLISANSMWDPCWGSEAGDGAVLQAVTIQEVANPYRFHRIVFASLRQSDQPMA